MSSGTKCWRIDCEVRTEGMVTGRVRSLFLRSGQAPCWPRIAEVSLQGLKSPEVIVLCTRAGVSELLAHDEWRLFFSLRQGILCVQRTGRNDRGRDNRGTALRSTNDYHLWGKCGPRLGAHTILGRSRK